MGQYEQLKNAVNAVIKQNGNEEITGNLLRDTLISIISNIGKYSTFGGVYSPTQNPGILDQNVFHVITEPGQYQYFNNIILPERSIGFVYKNQSNAQEFKFFTIPEQDLTPILNELEGLKNNFEQSVNLLNKETDFLLGVYNAGTGVFIDHTNQTVKPNLATKLMPVKPLKHYAIVGGNTVNSPARFVFRKENGDLISTVTGTAAGLFPIRFQTPAETAFVGITAAYLGNNQETWQSILDGVKNGFMLVELESETAPIPPYVPYGFYVDAGNIKGLDEKIAENPTINQQFIGIENDINSLLDLYNNICNFNGSASIDIAGNGYYINEIGDFLELKVKASTDTIFFNQGLGMIGTNTNQNGTFGMYNAGQFYLRDEAGGSWKIFSHSINIFEFNVIKLAINAQNKWEVFVNGQSIGIADRTGGFKITNIGKSYIGTYAFNGAYQYLKIKVGTQQYEFDDFFNIPNATVVGVIKELQPKQQENDEQTNIFPNMFVEYSPTMYNGRNGFNIFTKLNGTKDLYIKYTLYRNYDMSELIYWDYYKLNECNVFKYTGNSFVSINKRALIGSENEFTMLQVGKTDHSGGVHGDEIFTSARFKIDGIMIDSMDVLIPLTKCTTFEYQIISNIHETANSATPTEPISGHPIIAEHIKTVKITTDELEIRNVVKFKKTGLSIVRAYTGLVCVGKDFAESGFNEYGDFAVFNSLDNSQKLSSNYGHSVYFSGNIGGCVVTSEVVAIHKPTEKYVDLYKQLSRMWVTDRTGDSKYYRILGTTSESQAINVDLNEIWDLKCVVKFTGKEN